MKKKSSTAPVRANVRGTCADHVRRACIVWPGATGASSGISTTVRSSVLPSSGAMKRMRAVTSAGPPPDAIRRTLVTSIDAHSASRRVSSRAPASARSRIQVDVVLRQAL